VSSMRQICDTTDRLYVIRHVLSSPKSIRDFYTELVIQPENVSIPYHLFVREKQRDVPIETRSNY